MAVGADLDGLYVARHGVSVDIDVTRGPTVVRDGTAGGAPLGTSGRGRLKVYNRPDGEGGYALIEARHGHGEPSIRDHVHLQHEETFVILEGQYQVRLGDDIIAVEAGDYVFIPRGTAHTYRNPGPATARVLNIISPADGAELLVELGALGGGVVDETLLDDVFARHGVLAANPLPAW